MTYRVAILGAGIGAEHMPGYLALPGRFDVRTVCDLDEIRARSVVDQAPDCSVVTDIDRVIADSEIDIVDICLPPHLHGPVAIRALAAGKQVICEKPLAASVVEAEAMLAAAQKAGRHLFPIFQYRYGRSLYQLNGLIDLGLTGKPFAGTLETHWNRGADYYSNPWRGTWAGEGGGAVLSHAIHVHDLGFSFFGSATSVSAFIDTRVNSIETEDCAAISFATETGALVTSSITLGASQDTSRLRLVFEKLTAESGRRPYAPGQDAWQFIAREPKHQRLIQSALAGLEDSLADRPQGFAGQFLAVADVLDGTGFAAPTAREGLRSIEFVAAIYLAHRTGSRIDLPLSREHPVCQSWVP